jgi:hypothetical protein
MYSTLPTRGTTYLGGGVSADKTVVTISESQVTQVRPEGETGATTGWLVGTSR